MDNRKNNKGTIGNKGGRKPKEDVFKLIEQMDAVAIPKAIWEKLYYKVRGGDTLAIKTWLQYRYGMPKQTIDQTTKIEPLNYTEEERDKRIEQLLKKV